MLQNIPEVKLGVIAVSRSCFPAALSERRRTALTAACGDGLYECPVTVENEVQAKEAVKGGCDVVVADGFSGNVMLKTIEGVGSFMGGELKGMFMENLGTKAAALLVKKGLDRFKETLNPDRVGGTPFLGLTRPVIKAHGASNARAIENAIRQAWTVAGSGLAEDIEAHIGLMKPER